MSKFKVGDKVRIDHSGELYNDLPGFKNNCWVPEMDEEVGRVCTIKSIGSSGVRMEEIGWGYPPQCLVLHNTTKDTNPKDAVGSKKPPMSTVSGPVLQEVGVAMLEGALKYGRHNYRVAGVRSSVYYDALFRHMIAWWEGEDIDPDSGVSHLSKAIAGLAVLRDAQINNMLNDDRPPRPNKEHAKELQKIVDKLLEKYPDPKQPCIHIGEKYE